MKFQVNAALVGERVQVIVSGGPSTISVHAHLEYDDAKRLLAELGECIARISGKVRPK